MKNHIAFKFAAVLLAALMLLGTIASGCGVLLLNNYDLYNQTWEEGYSELMRNTREGFAQALVFRFASMEIGGCSTPLIDDYYGNGALYTSFRWGKYAYTVRSKNDEEVVALDREIPNAEHFEIPVENGRFIYLISEKDVEETTAERLQNTASAATAATVPTEPETAPQTETVETTEVTVSAVTEETETTAAEETAAAETSEETEDETAGAETEAAAEETTAKETAEKDEKSNEETKASEESEDQKSKEETRPQETASQESDASEETAGEETAAAETSEETVTEAAEETADVTSEPSEEPPSENPEEEEAEERMEAPPAKYRANPYFTRDQYD